MGNVTKRRPAQPAEMTLVATVQLERQLIWIRLSGKGLSGKGLSGEGLSGNSAAGAAPGAPRCAAFREWSAERGRTSADTRRTGGTVPT